LPPGGSCLLGSLNLAEFVDSNGNLDFEELGEAAFIATVALNDVLDEGLPLHPLQEQRDSVRDWRQIGLGVMGVADMLIKMGVRYGSPESIDICRSVADTILNSAVYASANLAAQDDPFPMYDEQKLAKSPFYSLNISEDNKKYIHEYGLRNSQLLTIAPTGTLSTMIGVSGGLEPIFANFYTRKTESLYEEAKEYKVYTPIVKTYMEAHNLKDDSELPDFFVTSADIAPHDRVLMQAAWQRYIDASISSTVNLPFEATVEDVEKIYFDAWENGLKGITVFRNGCRRAGILTTETKKEENPAPEPTPKSEKLNEIDVLPRGAVIESSDNVVGKKRKLTTGCGSLHCTAFFDPENGDLLETYLSKGSSGGCNNYMVGLSRMISLAARSGCDIFAIVDQLHSCGVCPSYAVRSATKHDTSKGSCCPVAIGNALMDMWTEMQSEIGSPETPEVCDPHKPHVHEDTVKPAKGEKHLCPKCGNEIVHEGGCDVCKSCGWSRCE